MEKGGGLLFMHGNEESLANLDSLWERGQIQTSWKLEPCFKAATSIFQHYGGPNGS